jgi:uncharacterized protein DUF6208
MLFSSFLRIPAASASFMLFHAVKWLLHRLRRVRERNGETLAWTTLSEVFGRPLALPYIMVTGPRWNPHALISRVGPFQVEHSLRMRTDTAHAAAQMWTLVISRASDTHAVATIDSSRISRDHEWHIQPLPPGRYTGALRYYELTADPHLPALEIDNGRQIPERAVSPTESDYLQTIRHKDSVFYTCLHYYVLEMLRLRRYLPDSFVRREYLPVGNPETAFSFGYLPRGQRLSISSNLGIPEGHRLYLTLYNGASFPVHWCEVQALPYDAPPAEASGSYLLRLHSTLPRPTPPMWPEHLHVNLHKPSET